MQIVVDIKPLRNPDGDGGPMYQTNFHSYNRTECRQPGIPAHMLNIKTLLQPDEGKTDGALDHLQLIQGRVSSRLPNLHWPTGKYRNIQD
jgi:hypothetical protein